MPGPNVWLRLRHADGFTNEVFDYFKAACRMYQVRIESFIVNWESLATTRGTSKPTARFFPAELAEDRSTASLPILVEGGTLGFRSLLHDTAKDLYAFLPVGFMIGVEAGVTEPSFEEDGGWRSDWWNPHQPVSAPPDDFVNTVVRSGGRVVAVEELEAGFASPKDSE